MTPVRNKMNDGSTAPQISIESRGPEETNAIGMAIGRVLQIGDIVCLVGELGAGKTTFTQGIAVGLGIPSEVIVNSPTFTILSEHPEGRIPLYHFDVYRLADWRDMYDLAFDEYLDGSGVVVIEWADRIKDALPAEIILVTLSDTGPDRRLIDIQGLGPLSAERLGRIKLEQLNRADRTGHGDDMRGEGLERTA